MDSNCRRGAATGGSNGYVQLVLEHFRQLRASGVLRADENSSARASYVAHTEKTGDRGGDELPADHSNGTSPPPPRSSPQP